MKKKLIKSLSLINILSLIALIILPALYFTQKAEASGLTEAVVRLDRLSASVTTGGTVCAKATTTDTETMVMVTFPSAFTVNGTAANWTVTTTNLPYGATAWPGIGTATLVASKSVTFPSTDLTVGTMYCFNFSGTTTLTNPTAANDLVGSITTQKSGPTTIDSAQFALSVVSAGYDQVSITGTINPTFSFTLSAITANFTSIANSVANTSSNPTVTIVTNARNGWTAWVKDANNGTLNSAGTASNIPTPGAVGSNYDLSGMTSTGAFGLGVTTTGGSSAPATEYSGVTAGHAGTLSNAFRPMATSTAYATSDVVTILPRAIASTSQAPATDYTDTITVVAAGQF